MTGEDRNGVQISHYHASAICTEVGERLQTALKKGSARLPLDLQRLTDLLDGVESRNPPSIEKDLGIEKDVGMEKDLG
jgi:hypothetical protein